ncbi:MAG TPA: class I SAM-dependent methyltransferase [Pyrinomonadaceae bacterium]|nr:class I SAM-dependent methyltransferase [Pyrinomonadaceae bacterium]
MGLGNELEYRRYLQTEIHLFECDGDGRVKALINTVTGSRIGQVLDVGCGAGQELLPFLERGASLGVGIDVQPAAGEVFRELFAERGFGERAVFIQTAGEALPFGDETYDLVICRVALPYMRCGEALAEMARIMRPGARLILTVHTPSFYLRMVRERIGTFSPKQLFYPAACFAGGLWYMISGRQPRAGFWKGKETFHTGSMLRRELSRAGLRIESEVPPDGKGGRTFVIVKT